MVWDGPYHFFSSFTSASYVEPPELPESDSVPELPPSLDCMHQGKSKCHDITSSGVKEADAFAEFRFWHQLSTVGTLGVTWPDCARCSPIFMRAFCRVETASLMLSAEVSESRSFRTLATSVLIASVTASGTCRNSNHAHALPVFGRAAPALF